MTLRRSHAVNPPMHSTRLLRLSSILAEVAGGSRGTTRRSVWRTSEFHLAETWLWSHREEKLEASSRTHEAQPPPHCAGISGSRAQTVHPRAGLSSHSASVARSTTWPVSDVVPTTTAFLCVCITISLMASFYYACRFASHFRCLAALGHRSTLWNLPAEPAGILE